MRDGDVQRQVCWLIGMIGRILRVQAQQAQAIDGLERRTRPARRRGRRLPAGRPALRLLVQTLGALLAGLAVAVVFSSGAGLAPSVGAAPAEADPTSTAGRSSGDGGPVSPQGGGGVAGPGRQTAPSAATSTSTTRPQAGQVPAGVPPESAPVSVTTTTSTTLPPSSTSTTLPPPSTTRPCRNPHGCDRPG